MNYRHHFHAGNFADVTKHVLLIRLLRALQQKEKGFLYLDTHAGRGAYDLVAAAVGDSLARTPEWPEGIGRLCRRADLPPGVAEYVDLVRSFDHQRGNLDSEVRFYPGSPWIARELVRPQDRLVFCEKHSSEAAALRSEFDRGGKNGTAISVQAGDGYIAMRAMLPPPERRALTLIDPPYEAQDEFVQAVDALEAALRRFPTGVYALWYPLTQRARVDEFVTAITALQPPPTMLAELAIAGDYSERKLKGCGLVVINPPWRFDQEANALLGYLAPVLAQEPGGGARTTWLVPDK
jgi:23S rRNA (adenine2030-N6)-methyltransferase